MNKQDIFLGGGVDLWVALLYMIFDGYRTSHIGAEQVM